MEFYTSLEDRRNSKSITEALGNDLARSQASSLQSRQNLVAALVSDLANEEIFSHWDAQALLFVLQGLKMLCREVETAKNLYTTEGIRALMRHAGLLPTVSLDDSAVTQESLRCLANCLLLDPGTRELFYSQDGADLLASKLLSAPLSRDSEFLFGRILFLATVSNSKSVSVLANNPEFLNKVGSIICQCIDTQPGTSPSQFSPEMTISEYLKMLFNMVTNFTSSVESKDTANADRTLKQELSANYSSLIPTLIRVITEIPCEPSAPISPPHSHAMHVLLNISIIGFESLWFPEDSAEPLALVTKLIEILVSVSNLRSTEESRSSEDMDTFFPPFLILMSNIAKENPAAHDLMKEQLLPDDIDRSKPLGKGRSVSDFLISLLTAGAMSRTKDTVGEFLFTLCDQDSSKFVAHVGYGNAIGFLTNHGIPFAPPNSHSQGEDGAEINPVTGQYLDNEPPDLSTMTDEEKEREAERLFVLFERLNKTGVVKVKNPVVEAMQSGKIHEIDDQD
ncbi:hypothetical protein K493DRAFT_83766 [Basidiobolus meristosporus CBS 931.73]|uniref:Guanine nucleotide exchange factor n=1 Tax=Basidiobolus meristosporus CBS 931.73 TaxID=1314790 RepID=A0A1Y1XK76_9FUNG|nr:hypothetical protein K493DRAFT_83766 [Basidiobolus meristosporus CBS 931.73]|eukprot:ORX86160.1 hypothetical protein K493DRAFT_83766 [Basidiobolus meristosporus CBS 931.73]